MALTRTSTKSFVPRCVYLDHVGARGMCCDEFIVTLFQRISESDVRARPNHLSLTLLVESRHAESSREEDVERACSSVLLVDTAAWFNLSHSRAV